MTFNEKMTEIKEDNTSLLFLVIPTILVITGIIFFQHPLEEEIKLLLPMPLFGSLILLGIGGFLRKENLASKLKMTGWMIFGFYWSTQPNTLYYGEEGDIVNACICIIGVFVLFYMAYHEWLSVKRKEYVECLNWIAGASSLAGFIYFIFELTPLALWLRGVVAAQSGWLLNIFTGGVTVDGLFISYDGAVIYIIFACTAVQSMVIFVGMILPLKNVGIKRRIIGLLVTVLPVYFLNLVRNALIVYLVSIKGNDFFPTAHNVIGKGGSLLALIILLFIVIKIVPEVFDEITSLTELPKRNGPIEKVITKYVWRTK
jgi:archaeosortase A (PGF-CTERM-specific)